MLDDSHSLAPGKTGNRFLIYRWESNNLTKNETLAFRSGQGIPGRNKFRITFLWYNILMFNRLMLLLSLLAVIIILAMINLTTPTSVGPLGVLVFFTMIYVVIYGVVNLIVVAFMKANGKKGGEKKNRYYSAMISFGPIMLLLIQSFGSLSVITVAMVMVFVALGCFVINKRL